MIQHRGDLGLYDSHEQYVWWFDLLFFFSLLENTENVPTDWIDEGTTQSRQCENE